MWAIKFINLVAVQGHFTSSAWYRWLQPLGFSLCFLHPSVAFCLKLKESMVNITAEVFPTQSTETLLYLREYLCISYLTPLIKCEHVLCCIVLYVQYDWQSQSASQISIERLCLDAKQVNNQNFKTNFSTCKLPETICKIYLTVGPIRCRHVCCIYFLNRELLELWWGCLSVSIDY